MEFRVKVASLAATAVALMLTGPVLAQDAPARPGADAPAGDEFNDEATIVVTGQRERGAVVGDIKPEERLTPADIRSYGVSSLTELLNELSPQTRSDRGRGGEAPVVLLNGRRISGFAEIRDIPTEAIQRVEILPEEVALKYGYSANQRVVNVVLRRRFNAVTPELTGSTPGEGGQLSGEAQASLLRIMQDGRLNLSAKYSKSSALTEDERDIISTTGSPGTPAIPDIGRYRTLLPSTEALSLNSVYNRTIFNNVSATVNASFDISDSDSLQGLPRLRLAVPATNPFAQSASDQRLTRYLTDRGPLARDSKSVSGHFGFSLNGDLSAWKWTLTGNYDHGYAHIRSDRSPDVSAIQALITAGDPTLDPFGPLPGNLLPRLSDDVSRSRTDTGNAQLVLYGPLFSLPAGMVTTNLKIGDEVSWFNARSTRGGITQTADLSRNIVNLQAGLDIPIASRKKNVLGAIGDLSFNVNATTDRISDFEAAETFGYGLNWTPIEGLNLILSKTHDETTPSSQQLGNPVSFTSNARVFDFLTGQTVDVTRLDGGNPNLHADSRNVFKAGLTWKPWSKTSLTLTANYVRSRIRNPIATFPTATPDIEAAFPGRFTRDADGNLLQIDSRPINFEREDRDELRWGFNFSKPLKTAQSQVDAWRNLRQQMDARNAAANPAGGSPAGGEGAANRPAGGDAPPGGAAGAMRGMGGPGGGQGGRLQFAAYHTWIFRDEILVQQGGPLLDLLNGSAIANSGGQARHQIELQAGYSNNGLGARLSGIWQSGTTVEGNGASSDLKFSSLATFNLRLFANLGGRPELVSRYPWLRGTRISLSVTNLFNARTHVHDATGQTPISYQPDYLDPLGRSFRISLRKMFFTAAPRPS